MVLAEAVDVNRKRVERKKENEIRRINLTNKIQDLTKQYHLAGPGETLSRLGIASLHPDEIEA